MVLGALKRIYRAVVPLSIRQSRLASASKRFIYGLLWHDAIYDADYYASNIERPAAASADVIADSVHFDLHPKTVVDVGCGTGALLEALRKKGCTVFGLEYSEAALRYCRAKGLEVRKVDLEAEPLQNDRIFDVAISMEVAEHLPEKSADRYVELLTRLSSVIVFTAAPPGQGVHDHVNEQPPSYWRSKFEALGFGYDERLSTRWRESWGSLTVVASWYCHNLMIFRRKRPA